MRIDVIGAGAWGTALALHAANNPKNNVVLWTRTPTAAAQMTAQGCNTAYLPGYKLPAALTVKDLSQTNSWHEITARSDLAVIATPMNALRQIVASLGDATTNFPALPLIWLCKGFEPPTPTASHGLMAHEIIAQLAPQQNLIGTLSGPSFAQEVAAQKPCAIVAASASQAMQELMMAAFHFGNLRLYRSSDIIGAEVGGAVKNVLAIAAGLCDGLDLGHNARAALITRGLSEMCRFGMALGAKFDTFMGLSGLGDLVLTTTGNLSRNRQVGLLLARGQTLEQAVTSLGHVAEGVNSAQTVVTRAQSLQVEMPLCELIVKLLNQQITPTQAVQQLMQRQPKAELSADPNN